MLTMHVGDSNSLVGEMTNNKIKLASNIVGQSFHYSKLHRGQNFCYEYEFVYEILRNALFIS